MAVSVFSSYGLQISLLHGLGSGTISDCSLKSRCGYYTIFSAKAVIKDCHCSCLCKQISAGKMEMSCHAHKGRSDEYVGWMCKPDSSALYFVHFTKEISQLKWCYGSRLPAPFHYQTPFSVAKLDPFGLRFSLLGV